MKFGKGGAIKGKNTTGRGGTGGGPGGGGVGGKGTVALIKSGGNYKVGNQKKAR